MKILKISIVTLLSFFATITATFADVSLTTKDIEGTWTRAKYIKTVSSMLSPFSARPETVMIENGKLLWTSYHEGFWQKIIRIEKGNAKNVYRLVLGGKDVESPDSETTEEALFRLIRKQDGKIEEIAFLDTSVVEFTDEPFVNISMPLQQFVAQLVLVGTYHDEKGQTYSFDKSGMASWPGQSFTYRVALDSTEAFCDYFFAISYKNRVGFKSIESKSIKSSFKWVSGKLELFNIGRDGCCVDCKGKPFAILTPVSK